MIAVVNKYKHKGPGVYIGRPSVFGNPFPVQMGREACIARYKDYLHEVMNDDIGSPLKRAMRELIARAKAGENLYLVCYCAPQACHGDVIKAYIEEQMK